LANFVIIQQFQTLEDFLMLLIILILVKLQRWV